MSEREKQAETQHQWEERRCNVFRKAHLCLNGGGSLGAQHLDSLKDVYHSLVPHPLQHDAEGDEYTSPPYSGTVGGQVGKYSELDVFRTVAPVVMYIAIGI